MSLRLATYNLKDFFLPPTEGDHAAVEAKVAHIAGQLRGADADVVGLQEVGSEDLTLRLVTTELADLGYAAPLFGTADKRGIRNAILSRLPVRSFKVHTSEALPFPRFVEGDAEPFPGRIPLRRGVVHVRVDAGALGEVDVLTCHLKSGHPRPLQTAKGVDVPDLTPFEVGQSEVRSLVQRAAEALHVRRLVDFLFAELPDRAICVMGDLNDTAESLPVRLLRGVGASNEQILHACADRVPEARRFSRCHGDKTFLIDHILVSAGLKRALAECTIRNDALRDHDTDAAAHTISEDSDHALCVAEFR